MADKNRFESETTVSKVVDQNFNATSANAQSGVAINNRINQFIYKTGVNKNETKTFTLPNASFVFITATDTHGAIYYVCNNTATLLCGSLPATVTLSISNYVLTIKNTQTWGIYVSIIQGAVLN